MNKCLTSYLVGILVLFSAVLNAQNRIIMKGSKAYLSNTIIIKLKTFPKPALSKSAEIERIFKNIINTTVQSVQNTFHSNTSALNDIYTVRFSSEQDPLILAAKLSRSPEVLWAEPRYLHRVGIVPNDPNYGAQNYLQKIKAEQAWDITTGDSTIVIGIIDTGVDWDHPDLQKNMWLNTDEIPSNSVDDDNNGFIDDYRGWDFGGLVGVEDNDPREDDPDHGTHVAGLASAVGNNGTGIASVGFSSKLMPVKVSTDAYRDAFGNPYVVFGFEGIAYAVENGAHIINCSWGSNSYSRLGEDVINFAVSRGALIIGASGNESTDESHFPSDYPGVLSVSSVNQNDVRSGFSNFGEGVDVSAPGESIYSTWQDDSYTYLSGTSMAAPIVAGLAALVKSRFPSFTPVQIGEQIRINSDPIDDLNNTYKRKLGFGRINALNAVSVQNSKSVRAVEISFSDNVSGSNGNGIFQSGETVEISIKLKNILNPTTSLQVTLENTNNYAQISEPVFNAGALNTSDSLSHVFRFTISNSVPKNYKLSFILNYSDGSYSDYQWLSLNVNPTYYTQQSGNVKLTITSEGRLGFNDYPENTQGDGFTYRNSNNLLFEGSFILGTSGTKVSDAARSQDINSQESDFKVLHPFTLSIPGTVADEQGFGVFNDDDAGSSKIGIETILNSFSYALIPYNDFIIIRYDLVNKSGSDIPNLFAGIFFDWDLVDGSEDKAEYNSENNFGYVWHNGLDTLPIVGSALISSDNYNYYAILNSGDDSGFGIYDGFTDAEKWQAMSEGISKKEAGPDDVSFVLSGGPFTVNSNDTLKVAFAVAAHDSLEGLREAIISSRTKYQNILTDVPEQDQIVLEFNLGQNYPNPFNPSTRINWTIERSGPVKIVLYDILGNEVKTILNEYKQAGIYSTSFDAGQLASGVYIYKLYTPGFQSAKKMILIR